MQERGNIQPIQGTVVSSHLAWQKFKCATTRTAKGAGSGWQ